MSGADDKTVQPEANESRQPMVTSILPVSEQIGRHVMDALQQPDTVAVLTTVVAGVDADRVVSLPLTEAQMDEVRVLLDEIQDEDEVQATDAEKCIGFQCQVPAQDQ